MSTAEFYFHDALNDLLPSQHRECWVAVQFKGRQSVKHLIEALGVPHTEIGSVEVGGEPVDTSYLAVDGEQISVCPHDAHSRSLDYWEPIFLLDGHLGKLAVYLRLLGFDTLYRNDFDDDELACLSVDTGRILLTRDRRLLMRKLIQRGYCLRSLDPPTQTREVLIRFGLERAVHPFKRCLRCNTALQPVSKETILDRLEPLTRQYYDEFHLCPQCDHVYWKGSHYEHMQAFLAKMEKGFVH